MANISIKNVKQATPAWYRKLKRVVNVGIVPVAILTIKGLWHGSDVVLNQVLLILTVTIPGVLEIIGLLLADETEIDSNENQ